MRKICGDAVGDKCKPIWGLNTEGEINGVWRDLGVPGLWYMTGACRNSLNRIHTSLPHSLCNGLIEMNVSQEISRSAGSTLNTLPFVCAGFFS